ncbi:hypothetical protein TrCOL_g13491 [Triparma columacea]|uniref:Uncharacterized protein n=1 Tax=Triparma columacea TaxID=722753 RepID=A0A9W7L1M8_9STRA|nr:hypothetical protein TrCOL_g13491 [Triparma columacea]
MCIAGAVGFWFKLHPASKPALSKFPTLWSQLLGVTTFTLTFFLNVSYALWRKCYLVSRRLQGRLNDVSLLLAGHAAREPKSAPSVQTGTEGMGGSVIGTSGYTQAARQTLLLASRYIRLFNLLTYASFCRSHRPLLTPLGMRRMVDRGIITELEREALTSAGVPATQRHNNVLLWIVRVFGDGVEGGVIRGGPGLEQNFLQRVHEIRAQYGSIGDELSGRMPLAYAHLVQVLVDIVLWLYPAMAFGSGMGAGLGVLGCGLLTLFYSGLLGLAKQFLDPYDNENYGAGDDPLVVDTLIAESNAGSVRWLRGFEVQPWDSQRLVDGGLDSLIRPEQGWSVAELEEMELEEERKRVMEAKKLEKSKAKEVDEKVSSGMGKEGRREGGEEEEEDDDKRLSEQLSDEVVGMLETDDLSDLPVALDAFKKEAQEALSKAEAELKETEAILNAGPLAESLEDFDQQFDEEAGEEEEQVDKEEVEVGTYQPKVGGEDPVVFVASSDPMGVPVPEKDRDDIQQVVKVGGKKEGGNKGKKDKGGDMFSEVMSEATKSVVLANVEKETIERIENMVVNSGLVEKEDDEEEGGGGEEGGEK